MNPAKIASLLLLSLLVASPVVFAIDELESEVSEIFAVQSVNGIHSTVGSSYFGRSLSGQFNGGVTPDFVYLSETTPVLVLNPNLYETAWKFPLAVGETVSDIARLPRLTDAGSDGILTAGSAGLQLWNVSGGELAPLSLETDPRWDGAHSLGVHDLDGDGIPDLFGIDANGDLVIKFAVGPLSTDLTIAPPLGETFDEVVALDDSWNPGLGKLVTIGSGGMRMYDHLGVSTVHWAAASPKAIAIVTEDGESDRIAMVYQPGPSQRLVVINAMGGFDTDLVLLDIDEISVMTSARIVHSTPTDLADDLVLVTAQNTKLHIFENLGSGAYNETHETEVVCGGGSGPENRTYPCFADFDGDRDMDGVYPDRGNLDNMGNVGTLTLLRGTGRNSFDYAPNAKSLAWLIATADAPGATTADEVYFTSEFVEAPEIQQILTGLGSGLELRLQIRYFRGPHRDRLTDRNLEDWGLGPDDFLQRGEEVPVDPMTGEVSRAAFFSSGEVVGAYPIAHDHIYFFFLRYVAVDSSTGIIRDFYPARGMGITTDFGTESLSYYLTTLPDAEGLFSVGINGWELPPGVNPDWFLQVPRPIVQDTPGTTTGPTLPGVHDGTGTGLDDPLPDLPEDVEPSSD